MPWIGGRPSGLRQPQCLVQFFLWSHLAWLESSFQILLSSIFSVCGPGVSQSAGKNPHLSWFLVSLPLRLSSYSVFPFSGVFFFFDACLCRLWRNDSICRSFDTFSRTLGNHYQVCVLRSGRSNRIFPLCSSQVLFGAACDGCWFPPLVYVVWVSFVSP